jgi:hypothetical protein
VDLIPFAHLNFIGMKKSKKHFSWGKSKYYFTIKSQPNNITMFRSSKEKAEQTFLKYKALGKEVEWLGKWTGKEFTEKAPPVVAA